MSTTIAALWWMELPIFDSQSETRSAVWQTKIGFVSFAPHNSTHPTPYL